MKTLILMVLSVLALMFITTPSFEKAALTNNLNSTIEDSTFVQARINAYFCADTMYEEDVNTLNNLIEYRDVLAKDLLNTRRELATPKHINNKGVIMVFGLILIISSKKTASIRVVLGLIMLVSTSVMGQSDTTVVFDGKFMTTYEVVDTVQLSDDELIAQLSDVELQVYKMVEDKDLYLEFKRTQITVVNTTRFSVQK